MKKGTKVSWNLGGPPEVRGSGRGLVIGDEDETGHVAVAVESLMGEPNAGWHPVIWCAVTWLRVEELPVQKAPPPGAGAGAPA